MPIKKNFSSAHRAKTTGTYTQQTDDDRLRWYVATKEFNIGELSTDTDQVTIAKHDKFEYCKGRLRYEGQEFLNVMSLQGGYNAGWFQLAPGETPDPSMERIKYQKTQANLRGGRAPVRNAATPPSRQPQAAPGPVLRNDIEVLPDGWESLTWTVKRKHIMSMHDVDLLMVLLEEEDERIKMFIKKRLDELKSLKGSKTPVQGVLEQEEEEYTPPVQKKSQFHDPAVTYVEEEEEIMDYEFPAARPSDSSLKVHKNSTNLTFDDSIQGYDEDANYAATDEYGNDFSFGDSETNELFE